MNFVLTVKDLWLIYVDNYLGIPKTVHNIYKHVIINVIMCISLWIN